ncbi:MAG: hypothetical protein E7515_06380 [Ruminococcaceae bacterium]|nr:hypothetical protein [Oscillospiraceae bacterium]
MKKAISLLLFVSIIICIFSSCAKKEELVQVGSVKVGRGVYEYFLSEAEKQSDSSPEEAAETAVLKYVAVNTKFEELKLSLNANQKSLASKRANSYWHLFSSYYEERGITKNDVYSVTLSDEYLKAIIRSIYDKDGTNPMPEKAIKEYFSNNYVAFKAIIELLQTTDENGVVTDITDQKLKSIQKQFNQMKKSLDGGTSFEKVDAAYQSKASENAEEETEAMLLSKASKAFPTGTFDEIVKIERDKAGVFTAGKYIFLVQRVGEFKNKAFYEENRDDCLIALGKTALEKTLESWAESLS